MATTKTKAPPYIQIPAELRARPHWVAYRLATRTNASGAPEETKEPINPHIGKLASVTDDQSWGTLDEAVAQAERDGLPGVGFVFSSGDPYCGIDLDHCFEPDGNLKPWGAEIVQSFAGKAYIEWSQSGEGLHIICKGKPSWHGKRKLKDGGAVEVYATERFFVMTGRPYGGAA